MSTIWLPEQTKGMKGRAPLLRGALQGCGADLATYSSCTAALMWLVISASCTHKLGDILYPCVLDADNAVEAWNAKFEKDPITIKDMMRQELGGSFEVTSRAGGFGHKRPDVSGRRPAGQG